MLLFEVLVAEALECNLSDYSLKNLIYFKRFISANMLK
jgi:hypothetical protein